MNDNSSAVTNAIVRALGDIAYDEAKMRCPVRTGRLKRSITKFVRTDRRSGTASVTIWTDVPYAGDVEFGGLGRRPKPFLEQGLEAARRSVGEVFSNKFKGVTK